jgi:hypothetical protein
LIFSIAISTCEDRKRVERVCINPKLVSVGVFIVDEENEEVGIINAQITILKKLD